MRLSQIVVVGMMVLAGWIAPARSVPSDSLTLDQAWQVLLQRNLTLKQQQAAIQRAEAALRQARTMRLPTLQAGGSYKYISEVPRLEVPPPPVPGFQFPEIQAGANNQYDLYLQVVQPVFTGMRLTNMVRLQNMQLQKTRVQAQRVQQQLLFQVGRLFYNYQLNKLQKEVLEASLQRLEAGVSRARALYQAKQVTAFDTLRLANQQLRLRNHIRNVERQNDIVLEKLRTILNLDSLAPPAGVSVTAITMHLPAEQSFQQQALAHRPELREMQLRQKSAQLGVRIAKAAYMPQVSAFAAVHYGNPGANFFKQEWNVYTLAGVQLSFDVWNWGRSYYRVQEKTALVRQLSLEEQKRLRAIREEVHTVYLQMQQVAENQAYLEQLVAQESLRYQLVKSKFENGYATSLDLQEAESALTSAQLQLQQNRIAWMQLQLQMKFVTGTIGKNLEEYHE